MSATPPDDSPTTDERVNLLADAREGRDPFEEHRGMPFLVGILVGAVALWGAWYLAVWSDFGLDNQYGDGRTTLGLMPPEPAGDAAASVDGAEVYQRICASCHQATGMGVAGAFPPLDGSEWVAMDGRVAASIVIHGLQGEIEVKGQTFNSMMPPFGGQLSDEEIAAVVTFVRSEWSNSAPEVSVAQVEESRSLFEGPIAGGAGLQGLLGER